jgi:hypothetical protein
MIDFAISMKYMLSGYITLFVIMTLYMISLFLRWQRLKHDLQALESLENQR